MIHAADIVVPVTSAPIPDGAVAVVDGSIAAVGTLADLRSQHPSSEVRKWDGVLVPGLVNAHTHLQYTTFDRVGAETYPDYVAWAVRFVAEYDARDDEDWVAAAVAGVDLSIRAGVTCIADVVTDWEARRVIGEAGLAGVAYLELIGTDLEDWEAGVETQLKEALDQGVVGDDFSLGVSPHAPYSVDDRVITAMVSLAHRLGVRVHTHVAEIDSEEELYRSGTGAWADRVRQVARRRVTLAHRGGMGIGTAEFTERLGLLDPMCHIAHGIYLDRSGRSMLAESGTIAALCPRSNLTLGQDPPPVADYLAEHVAFAVGTDSLGSSQSLDPLDDLALLRRLAIEGGYADPDLDRRLLWAATMGGAAAVGLERRLGSLEVGKRADFAVFDIDAGPDGVVPALVADGGDRCTGTVVAGQLRWTRSR